MHVRRLAFAEMLPNYAQFVKPGMFERTSGWHRLAGHMMWPVAVRIMIRGYDLGPGAAAESRSIIDVELDWLDSKLAGGRPYLAGKRFSRADLAVASALAAFAQPKEMPTFHNMRAPESLAARCASLGRPTNNALGARDVPHASSASELVDNGHLLDFRCWH